MRLTLGGGLLALQGALSCALIANALSVATTQWQDLRRGTGLDEAHLLILRSHSLDGAPQPLAAVAQDLAALRALPGVRAATRVNNLPLADHGWRFGVSATPMSEAQTAQHAAVFISDEHGVETLGLRLLEGRDFRADEVGEIGATSGYPPRALISRALADTLFPGQVATGRVVHSRTAGAITVLGVVERLQSAWPSWPLHEHSLLMPARLQRAEAIYVLRTDPGAQELVAATARERLLALDAKRVLGTPLAYAEIRAAGYRPQRALASLLLGLVLALLLVAGIGIFGTARYWVLRRQREIGTRRALGARRGHILHAVLGEQAGIALAGVTMGLPLAWLLNQSLQDAYAVGALEGTATLLAAVLLLVLGPLAALGPAQRAAAVPPAVATRNL